MFVMVILQNVPYIFFCKKNKHRPVGWKSGGTGFNPSGACKLLAMAMSSWESSWEKSIMGPMAGQPTYPSKIKAWTLPAWLRETAPLIRPGYFSGRGTLGRVGWSAIKMVRLFFWGSWTSWSWGPSWLGKGSCPSYHQCSCKIHPPRRTIVSIMKNFRTEDSTRKKLSCWHSCSLESWISWMILLARCQGWFLVVRGGR